MPEWSHIARLVAARHEAVDQTYHRYRSAGGPQNRGAWEAAAADFRGAAANLHRQVEPILDGLRAADPSFARLALDFLEADVRCFHSGYLKEAVLTGLKRVRLDGTVQARLRELTRRWVLGNCGREFRYLARLAPRIATPGFLAEMQELERASESKSRHRARQVLHVLRSAGWE